MPIIKTLPDRLRQVSDIHWRPEFDCVRAAVANALTDRLAAEDSATKTAVVIGADAELAHALGLRKTRILRLPYPDFTLDNLALLSDEYDFVITDRMLHLSDNLDDAATETIRVLKPGGWFVHTTSIFDFSVYGNIDSRRRKPRRLRTLFPHCTADAGGSAISSWVVGQKAEHAPPIEPTANTRRARRRWYRFKPRPARFGVVAIARNEAPYLLEWIAHYRLLGFEQIAIYDNLSNDASARILAPLARAGIINVVQWRDRVKKQRKAYNNARRRLRDFVEWCLAVDLDEFLILDQGVSLNDIIPTQPDVSGIVIPWRMYRSGGKRNREAGLTIERFLMADAENARHVKSLVRLRSIRSMQVHIPKRYVGRLIDINGSEVSAGNLHKLGKTAPLTPRINHYHTRSWEEFTFKRMRGRAAKAGILRSVDWFARAGPGEVELRDTLRLVPSVREEVERLRKLIGAF